MSWFFLVSVHTLEQFLTIVNTQVLTSLFPPAKSFFSVLLRNSALLVCGPAFKKITVYLLHYMYTVYVPNRLDAVDFFAVICLLGEILHVAQGHSVQLRFKL